MIGLLYDVHGNLPALEAVLEDADAQGVERWLLGGDFVLFGAWPGETLARLRELPEATWIRGNGDRWTAGRDEAAEDADLRRAVDFARAGTGAAAADALGELPESAPLADGTTRAWHASPVSDVRSFLPVPDEDEPELLSGVAERRIVFGHTHLPFRRTAATGVELVNPGSVGMPLDGDHRAAYALLHPDATFAAHRRVAYDHGAAARAVRDADPGAAWAAMIVGRLERAAA